MAQSAERHLPFPRRTVVWQHQEWRLCMPRGSGSGVYAPGPEPAMSRNQRPTPTLMACAGRGKAIRVDAGVATKTAAVNRRPAPERERCYAALRLRANRDRGSLVAKPGLWKINWPTLHLTSSKLIRPFAEAHREAKFALPPFRPWPAKTCCLVLPNPKFAHVVASAVANFRFTGGLPCFQHRLYYVAECLLVRGIPSRIFDVNCATDRV